MSSTFWRQIVKKKHPDIKLRISVKITLVLLVFNIVMSFIVGTLYNDITEARNIEEYISNMEQISNIMSYIVDGDILDRIRMTNEYATNDTLDDLADIYEKINEEKKTMDIYFFYPYKDNPYLYCMITKDMIDDNGNVDIKMMSELLKVRNPQYDVYDSEVIVPLMRGDDPQPGSEILTGEYYRDRVSEEEYEKNPDGMSYVMWCPIFNSKDELAGVVEMYGLMNDYFEGVKARERVIQAMITIFFILATFFAVMLVNMAVVKKIRRLERYITSYEGNEFKAKKPEFITKDEISLLLDSFTQMNEKVEKYQTELVEMTADSARMQTELSVAEGIQNAMLVTDFPAFPECPQFELHASMDAASVVGGDFYDFYKLDDNHIALVVADVSGGNVSGAMFMMRSIVSLRLKSVAKLDPAAILYEVNNDLCNRNSEQMFVTVWLGILDISTGKLLCSNGGHERPAISRNGGSFEYIDNPHDFVLGGLENMEYKNYEIQLNPGDIIFQYSDGVTEENNRNEELYGEERLLSALSECVKLEPEQVIESMRKRLREFADGAVQSDDITMLCIKYTGSS